MSEEASGQWGEEASGVKRPVGCRGQSPVRMTGRRGEKGGMRKFHYGLVSVSDGKSRCSVQLIGGSV